MRVLFDITHPANVHFFRHLISRLIHEEHQVLVTAREKDVTLALLDGLGIPHICISRRGVGLIRAAKELVVRDVRLLQVARRFRPDVPVGIENSVLLIIQGLIDLEQISILPYYLPFRTIARRAN